MLPAIFIASLLGSAHCAAMCGPLAGAALAPGARMAALHYHGARLAVYLALGAAAGALGTAADALTPGGSPAVAARLAGWLLVLLGAFGLLRASGVRLPRVGAPVHRWLHGALARMRAIPPRHRAIGLGAATALLPCGWLYAFLAAAAGTGSPGRGALAMGAFWVGTVPAVTAGSIVLQRLSGRLRPKLPTFGAIALITIGLLTALERPHRPRMSGDPAPTAPHDHRSR